MTEHIKVTIGADPELFVKDIATGKIISAHDLIPGTKYRPTVVPRGAIHPDGVAAEFCIEPAGTQKEFIRNIQHVKNLLENMIKLKAQNYRLVAQPTAMFDAEYFKGLPEDVLLLGCEPDYSAYTCMPNSKPETDKPMRTGSGHVHIGFNGDVKADPVDMGYMEKCSSLVKQLDFAFLGTLQEWDFDTQRQELYGKPGAFRPKTYGLEYRVLSNAWLQQDWSIRFVYDTVKAVTQRWLKGFDLLAMAEQRKIRVTDKFETFSDFMYLMNLPAISQYSPRFFKEETVH